MIGGVICPPVEAVDFDRRREMLLVAETDHRRDGQRADRDGVRDRRAGDHPEQGRAEDRDLCRTPGIAPRDPGGAIEEQLAEADAGREDAEQHEVENVGRNDAERDAVDALGGKIEVIDHLGEARARMHQDAGHEAPEDRVEDEQGRDDRQRPPDGAAGRLEEDQDQHGAERHVHHSRVTDPEGEIVEWDQGNVCDRDHGREREDPIDERDAEGPPNASLGRPVIAALGKGEDQEDQAKHEGEVDAPVHRLLQEAESGSVVVEQRQHDEQRANELAGRGRERAEADLGVELLLELAGLRLVKFHRGHDGSIARDVSFRGAPQA